MGSVAVLVVAAIAAVLVLHPGPAADGGPAAEVAAIGTNGPPCGTRRLATTTRYTHVIWVWMENHGYDSIVGSSEAPYINRLAHDCGLATNYHSIGHPSLPNYVAATSGLALPALTAFATDCIPSRACSTTAPSIFSQVPDWAAYEEAMPFDCHRTDAGGYAVRHNPPTYYVSPGGCAQKDVPYVRIASALGSNRRLPAFAFVTPNLTDDMHDGSIGQGDAWLAANLPAIFDSSVYRSGSVALFLTWDEGEGGSARDCATNTTDAGCHVATIVVSPTTRPGTRSGTLFNHYSLLGTTEQLLGVPRLGRAARARSMLGAFGL